MGAALYDSTNSVFIPGSNIYLYALGIQATFSSSTVYQKTSTTFPFILYTVTASAVIHLYGLFGTSSVTMYASSGSNAHLL